MVPCVWHWRRLTTCCKQARPRAGGHCLRLSQQGRSPMRERTSLCWRQNPVMYQMHRRCLAQHKLLSFVRLAAFPGHVCHSHNDRRAVFDWHGRSQVPVLLQALQEITSLPDQRLKAAALASARTLPTLMRLMLQPSRGLTPTPSATQQGCTQSQPAWLQSMLPDAFTSKSSTLSSKHFQNGTAEDRLRLDQATGASATVASAVAAGPPGQPPQPSAATSETTMPGKDQQQRAAWLSKQHADRVGAAARHAAAVLRGCQRHIAGLQMFAAELIGAAMGGEHGLAGGPIIADSAAHLLASMQPHAIPPA